MSVAKKESKVKSDGKYHSVRKQKLSLCERGAGHQCAANGAVKENNSSSKRLHKDLRSSRP